MNVLLRVCHELTILGRNGDDEICRTRLETCRIENREFELAEGFRELGNDHSDNTKSWDWVSSWEARLASADPSGHSFALTSCLEFSCRLDDSGTLSPSLASAAWSCNRFAEYAWRNDALTSRPHGHFSPVFRCVMDGSPWLTHPYP